MEAVDMFAKICVQKSRSFIIYCLLNTFLKVQNTTGTLARTAAYVQEWHIPKYQLISSSPR